MIRGHTGWIDFDVRSAIKQWDKSRRNGGNGDSNNRYSIMPGKLAIDVEDPDQNPLKAGNFFEPIQCEACKCAVYHDLTNKQISLFQNSFDKKKRIKE